MSGVGDELLVWLLRTLSDVEHGPHGAVEGVLAGVEADRAVLTWTTANLDPNRLEPVLRIVASRYRHRAGYVEGWAPGAICTPPSLDDLSDYCGLPWGHMGRHFPRGAF